jgi:SHS2 domain-containing protein
MSKPYRYLNHTADLGLEVSGKTLADLFANTGQAIFETQVGGKIKNDKEKSVKLKSETIEDLYLDWCRELLFNFTAEGFIPVHYEMTIRDLGLVARLHGDLYDPKRHHVRIEIKNPTYHELKIEKNEQGFRARIIFDV